MAFVLRASFYLQHVEHRILDLAVLLSVYLAEVELYAEQEVTAKDVVIYVFHIFG